MRELFRDIEFTKVGYWKSILESHGIETFIKNRDLSSLAGEVAILPEVWPALCVVNDEDYERARQLMKETAENDAAQSEVEVKCPSCGEENPGNFELCWSCGSEINTGS
ncbi:MAG: DUF2007 domain-containing protein [Verrucomicrobiales bacterium]|nr:DUF2007 domain-containing protein [Verrucomicrobiales bacterium]